MLTYRSLAVLVIIAFTQATASFSQTVRGTVLDDSTSQPIGGAEVTVLDSLGVDVARTLSDSTGRFRLSVTPGDYSFRVLRIGYAPTVTTVLHATRSTDEISVILRVASASALLDDAPYALTPVVVEARPADRYMSRFYEHQAAGQGEFAQREEFEQWHPRQVTDVVRRMQGFSIVPNIHYGQTFPDGGIDTRELIFDVHGRRHSGADEECPPLIFLDGAQLGDSRTIDVNDLPLDAIEAVETYTRPVQTPMAYLRPGNDCGVVALWRRAAAPGEARSPFELGMRFGGTVAGGSFTGGRLGIHFIAPFKGALEFYPAIYVVSNALSDQETFENSGWMAQIALRMKFRHRFAPLYLGSGLVLVKPSASYWTSLQPADIDPAHTIFAGLARAIGPTRPFVEVHVLDLLGFSGVSAQAFMGIGVQF